MDEPTSSAAKSGPGAGKARVADKRASILEGARKVFFDEGYQRASMDRIAQEAGVSKQTIYSHFKDKQTLFNALLEQLGRQFCLKDIAINVLTKEPREFLREFAQNFAAQFDDPVFVGMQRLMVEESVRNPQLGRTFIETVAEPGYVMMGSYLSLHPKIKVADPEATTRLFFAGIAGFMHQQKMLGGGHVKEFDRNRYIDRLVDAVLSGS